MADHLAPLPYYKWFWQRWRANRNVQRMRLADRGAYRELIDECWAEGFIPDDVAALADICGCEVEEMSEVWPRIKARFYETQPGRYTNRALEDQRTELDALRVKNSKNAKYAALARLEAANAERTLATAGDSLGDRHIEEERREEKSKEEESNAPAAISRSPLLSSDHDGLADEAQAGPTKNTRKGGKVAKIDAITLPEFVPEVAWREWVKVKKGAKTPFALSLALGKLSEFHGQGYCVSAILGDATEGAWTSLYANEKTPKRKQVFVEVAPEEFWAGTGVMHA